MSTVTENSFINIFDLWWNAILLESEEFNQALLCEKHCPESETREINFDKSENRLAYMYRFGYFNVQFVEKCITNFLDNFTEAEHLFSRENLKICSLSNGPGLDLIGLLIAIYKSSIYLKCFPVLKLINLYSSWWNACKTIFNDFYKVINSSLQEKINVPPVIIHLTQNDIYSSISLEAKDCIIDSDILLMVKVFASSKATYDKALNCMKEIFSLIKPGSFVFFIGSKKITKELTENNSLNLSVNAILGPTKISIKDLYVDHDLKHVAVKPLNSGSAYFVVWQKKDVTDTNTKKKRRGKKNKSKVNVQKKVTDSITVLNEVTGNNDTCSEISLSSSSKQSETLSDDYKSTSYENIFQSESTVDIRGEDLEKKEHNLSQKDQLLLAACNDLREEGLTQVVDDTIVSNELKGDTDTNSKMKRRGKKEKSKVNAQKKITDSITLLSDVTDNIDAYSEISLSSRSKQSKTLSDEYKATSFENIFQPMSIVDIRTDGLEKKEKLSELTTALHAHIFRSNSTVEVCKKNLTKKDRNLSLNDLPLAINSVTSCLDKEGVIAQTKSQDDSIKQTSAGQKFKLEMVSSEVSENLKSPVVDEISSCGEVNEKCVFPHMNQEQNILQKHTLPSKITSTFLIDKSQAKHSFKDGNMHSLQLPNVLLVNESTSNLKKNWKSGEFEMCTVSHKNIAQTPSKASKSKKVDLTPINCLENKNSVVLKGSFNDEVSMTMSYTKDNINFASKILDKSEIIKGSKNKKQSVINKESAILPDVTVNNKIGKNMHKIVVENQVHESLFQFKRSLSLEEKTSLERDKTKQDLDLLLLHCESLVASLEKLTESVKKNILSTQDSKRCLNEPCAKFKHLHACASSCCSLYSNCSRNICNCQMYLKSSCPNCTKIKPYKTNRTEICECSVEPKRFSNVSPPHIVIPIMNEDILQMLTSKQS